MSQDIYDLVIVGGGPAGMTAAIYAARAKMNVLLLESNITGGLVNSTWTVENFPSYPSIHGIDLMKKMRAHVDSLEVPVHEVCDIEEIDLTSQIKKITTDEGVFSTKTVILATGRSPIPLDVAETCDQLHFCAICDGSAYAGKRVLVVGGGNSAFDESLYMLNLGVEHITIVEVMDRYFAAQATQEQLFASGKVEGMLSCKVDCLCVENNEMKGVTVENVCTGEKKTINVDGAFIFLGQKPNNALFKDVLQLNEQGYIVAGPDMSTSIPGVFGAGDINNKQFRQITTAVSDGTIAALTAEKYLRQNS